MLTAHFGFNAKPFTRKPGVDTHDLNPAAAIAYTGLVNDLNGGFAALIVTGAPGTGKTFLLQKLLAQAPRPDNRLLLLGGSPVRFSAYVDALLDRLDANTRSSIVSGRRQQLAQRLKRLARAGTQTIVAVDDAHRLDTATAVELLALCALDPHGTRLCQLLLVGEPALTTLIKTLPKHSQRFGLNISHHRLETLNELQTHSYIAGQIAQVKPYGRNPFSDEACQSVYRYSCGVPRSVNCLCLTALVLAERAGHEQVGAAHVTSAARQLGLDRIPPVSAATHEPETETEIEAAPTPGQGTAPPSGKPNPAATFVAAAVAIALLGALVLLTLPHKSGPPNPVAGTALPIKPPFGEPSGTERSSLPAAEPGHSHPATTRPPFRAGSED